jgi:hypothetical protein
VIVYLASPNTQQQAEHASDMPVLLSFACWAPWLDSYQHSFSRLLIDSGAYSEMTTGKKVDGAAYKDWCQRWEPHADAAAGLDDISGDWRRSLSNYEKFGGFPTIHDTDPPELLKDLIPIARERGKWLGIGLKPPREGKEDFVRAVCDQIPDDIHVHGWALRRYTNVRRLDSVDSTNWWRDALDLRMLKDLQHLTYGECLEIIVKRYQRWERKITTPEKTRCLFD